MTGYLSDYKKEQAQLDAAKKERHWNFDIDTDVLVMKGSPCVMLPPLPQIEHMRANLVEKMRQKYQQLCKTKEGIDAPLESFNRWMMERKMCDNGCDAMLATDCNNPISPAMYREIMHDIPIRLLRIKCASDARKQLFCYSEAIRTMIESRSTNSETLRFVKQQTDEVMYWLRKEQNPHIDEYLNWLAHLRRKCKDHVVETAKASVKEICLQMYQMSINCAKEILDEHRTIMQRSNIDTQITFHPTTGIVPGSPIVLPYQSPPVTGVTQVIEKNLVLLTYKSDTLKLNREYLKKLELLYRSSCQDDPRLELFLPRVWCLLRRYQTFFGPNQYEGIMLHGALPTPVFECLSETFGVTMECFASPLNCFFRHYSSAFADTDSYFGSSGHILHFFPISGSFEANPPFAEELMEAMVIHFVKLLSQSNEPLSFIVSVPEWRDPTPMALLRMENSLFNRKQVLIPAYEHEYRSGLQHAMEKEKVNHKSAHGTLIFFLQNEAGFMKWGPTEERLIKLFAAFKPKSPH